MEIVKEKEIMLPNKELVMSKIIDLLKRKLDIKTDIHGRAVLSDYPKEQIESFELEMIDAELELLREQQKITCTPIIIQPSPQDVVELEKALRDELNRKYPLLKVDSPPQDISDDIRSRMGEKKPLETREIGGNERKEISNPYKGVLTGSRLAPSGNMCNVNGCILFRGHDGLCCTEIRAKGNKIMANVGVPKGFGKQIPQLECKVCEGCIRMVDHLGDCKDKDGNILRIL